MVAVFGTSWFTVAAACTALLATVAEAHITLTVTKALDGTYTTTALRVPHGCTSFDYSPTRAITMTMPDKVYKVQMEYIPGWNASFEMEPISAPVLVHGANVTERVKTVKWEGGPLPVGQFIEFGLRILMPKAKEQNKPELLYFPTLQECVTGGDNWNQIPAEQGDLVDFNAPFIELNTVLDGQSSSSNTLQQGVLTVVAAGFTAYILA